MNKQIIITFISEEYGYNVVEMVDGVSITDFIFAHLSTIEEQFPKSEWKWIML